MTKETCKESSTDSSEVCYKVKCESKCEQSCCIPACDCYRPEEIVCKFGDAVVEVHSEFILLGNGQLGASAGVGLGPNIRYDTILEGNGFFIKGHYIVTPAHLVLMPPSLTSVVNRYPFVETGPHIVGVSGHIQNEMVCASRILVSVFNVNGKGHSFVYEAELVGVDGAGDIAVLKINYKKQWNLCNPCIEKCHPVLTFGESRAAKVGEKVYLIGDFVTSNQNTKLFNGVGAITDGLLADHRYLDYSGWVLPETVLVSAGAYAFSSGLPILNCQGKVLGMQTTDLSSVQYPTNSEGGEGFNNGQIQSASTQAGIGFVAGPSEFFMRRVIKALIKGTCSRKNDCKLELICDPVNAYFRYMKAYAGIAYDVFTGSQYDQTIDYTGHDFPKSFPRIRLDENGEFLSSPSCKEIIGLRVLSLAGETGGAFFVPGANTLSLFAEALPNSPFLGKLRDGDIITHIRGIALGDLEEQIAPSLITWRLCKEDRVEICYRRGGNASNL
jgi:S1-C subfamily serine protease